MLLVGKPQQARFVSCTQYQVLKIFLFGRQSSRYMIKVLFIQKKVLTARNTPQYSTKLTVSSELCLHQHAYKKGTIHAACPCYYLFA